ncbi:hypothetical protein EDB19DRAFT_1192274 [Suillus lakei]|nr:hypothetical protein EDB19DRAFT_1192274 [Suillus lakei]
MHPALLINDIAHLILENLRSSPSDLAHVAQTCRGLVDPALDILWSRMLSLAPLIMCLPRDTWEVKSNTIHFTREPLPMEWALLKPNASRVRQLALSDLCGRSLPRLSRPVLESLFLQIPPKILFPGLFALQFEIMSERSALSSNFRLLRQFCSPQLEHLSFNVPQHIPTDQVERLVDALPLEACSLRQLFISAGPGTSTFTVPPSVGQLPRLIALEIEGIDVGLTRQMIANIQPARHLQTLLLTLGGTTHDAGGMPLALQSLKDLYLSCDSLPPCTHFIRQLTAAPLSTIHIKYKEPASPSEIAVLIESLSTTCETFGSLREICVVDRSHTDHGHEDPEESELYIPLRSEIFRPLLKFHNLRSVVFVGIGNYELDDRFINDAGVAWPGLQKLKFASHRLETCNVSFTAMMSLASSCRSLQALHLTINATQPTTVPRAADGTEEIWPTQSALYKLHLGHSQVSEVGRVPHFLTEIFPSVEDFNWYANFGDSDLDGVIRSELAKAWEQLRVLRNLSDGSDEESDEEWEWEDDSDDSDT